MNSIAPERKELRPAPRNALSATAFARLHSMPGEPAFLADWLGVSFLHYEVDAAALQREVPFALDRFEGAAFVSVVTFTMCNAIPRRGGRIAAWLLRRLATHEYLNVRAYVRHEGEPGIFFLSEWVPGRWRTLLGLATFGLPYRHGRLAYNHEAEERECQGRVTDGCGHGEFAWRTMVKAGARLLPCAPGTLDEYLLERYTAFTSGAGRRRFFRIWHQPWLQARADASVFDESLLAARWPWFREARVFAANYSEGVLGVWIGWPHATT